MTTPLDRCSYHRCVLVENANRLERSVIRVPVLTMHREAWQRVGPESQRPVMRAGG
jgi:hypothetical protein